MDLMSIKKKSFASVYIIVAMLLNVISLPAQTNSLSKNGMFVAEKVKQGETFKSLSQKYYGNEVFWGYIFKANQSEIPRPDALRAGMSVTIPQAEALEINANNSASVEKAKELNNKILSGKSDAFVPSTTVSGKSSPLSPPPSHAIAKNSGSVVTKDGDTFRVLALKYYGSKEFWGYIYEANKSLFPNPNRLLKGVSVVIPDAKSLEIDANNPASIEKARELGRKILSKS